MKLVINGSQHVSVILYTEYVFMIFLSCHVALAGASATIASDALMNPFDGT